MMTLEETIPLMTSDDHDERLKAEYYQLKIRMNRLKEGLDRYPPPLCRLDLMAQQYKVMAVYLKLLEARMVDGDIDFTDDDDHEDEEYWLSLEE